MSINITVLIPAHGDSKFLVSALMSIKAQKFPNDFEILLINQRIDKKILNEIALLKLEKLRIIDDSGSGIVSALNLGVKQAKYEWIARLDSDDLMSEDRIKKQTIEVIKNPKLILVGGNAKRISPTNIVTGSINYPHSNFVIKKSLMVTSALPHPGVLMRKDKIMLAGGYLEEYKFVEDYDLWTRLAPLGDFKNIRSNVLYYRTHQDQVTKKYLSDIDKGIGKILARNFSEKQSVQLELFFQEITFDIRSKNYLNVFKTLAFSNISFSIKLRFFTYRLFSKLVLILEI